MSFVAIVAALLFNAVNPAQALTVLNGKFDIIGSSVLLSADTVLTAAHVVNEKNASFYVVCSGLPIKVKTAALKPAADIALLTLVSGCSDIPSKLAKENASVGSHTFSIGCPNKICGFVTSGIVSNYMNKDASYRLIAENKIWFGNSGGPLINDNNEVIGICSNILSFTDLEISSDSGIKSVSQNYSAWIPISEINLFLNSLQAVK